MSIKTTVQVSMELWGAILCLIFSQFIYFNEAEKTKRARLLSALVLQTAVLLVSDSIAWLTRGQLSRSAYWLVRISNYLVFTLNYSLGFTAMLYLDALLDLEGRHIHRYNQFAISFVCFLGLTEITISQFTGFLYTINESNLYSRSPGYWTISVVGTVMLILLLGCVFYYYRQTRSLQVFSLFLMFLLTLGDNLVQLMIYGISFVNLSMAVGITVMFLAYEKDRINHAAHRENLLLENSLQLARQQTVLAQQETILAQQEAELAKKDSQLATLNANLVENRTQIILSQIQPHFLYNALNAISFLCVKDPMKAKETVDFFSDYLRTNLDSLRSDRVVSFEDELNHTKAYLAIEQLRFGSDLQLVYDIQCTNFRLPSLSLQPIVENAVRHGICKREDGGTVTIRTEATDGNWCVTVMDDGIGFDPVQIRQDGKIHIGLDNVRQRLELLVNGDLLVNSTPGVGTTVVLVIPRQKDE